MNLLYTELFRAIPTEIAMDSLVRVLQAVAAFMYIREGRCRVCFHKCRTICWDLLEPVGSENGLKPNVVQRVQMTRVSCNFIQPLRAARPWRLPRHFFPTRRPSVSQLISAVGENSQQRQTHRRTRENAQQQSGILLWLVVWNIFIFPHIGNNHPNWVPTSTVYEEQCGNPENHHWCFARAALNIHGITYVCALKSGLPSGNQTWLKIPYERRF